MAQDWDDRDRSSRSYGRREDYGRQDRSRDWSDRAGDEVRSWFGDDDADRRRRLEDDRDYGMGGSSRRERSGYGDERGGSGGRFAGSSSYGSEQGSYGQRRGEEYGRGDYSGSSRSGMSGRSMGMANPSSGTGGDYGGSGYGRMGSSGRGYSGGDYGEERYRGGSDDRGFFERAGDAVSSWFGDEDAQSRRDRDVGHRGRGPKNYSRSDDRIREDVSDRLSDDRHIDASDIDVTVSGCEVTLDGTVDSRAAKRHAEDLAESCSGVKHVQNNLRVKDRQSTTSLSGSTGGRESLGSSSSTTSTTGMTGAGSGDAISGSSKTGMS